MSIDWHGVHRRLDRGTQGLARAFDPDPETLMLECRARAERYARDFLRAPSRLSTTRILVVRAGLREYGIALDELEHVAAELPISPLPAMADGVVGVTRFGRRDWLILCLSHLVGAHGGDGGEGAVCLLRNRGIGLWVDAAERLERVPASLLRETSPESSHVAGIDDNNVQVLRLDALLAANLERQHSLGGH